MSLITQAGKLTSMLPYKATSLISKLGYKFRPVIGGVYKERINDLKLFDDLSSTEQQEFIFSRIKNLVIHAFNNTNFYRSYYQSNDFNPNKDLNSFCDIKSIPIVNKDILKSVSLEERSAKVNKRYVVNTAGSSGKPFDLYILPNSIGHEWAHMHKAWKKVNFDYKDLRLSLIGRISSKNLLVYDPLRHTFNLNIYLDHARYIKEILDLFASKPIRYIHGYPSAIYEFAILCKEKLSSSQLAIIQENLQGVLLGSEFPVPKWRNIIEDVFNCDSLSWYGHTERCVLAYEKVEKYEYHPFHTYGFSETVNVDGRFELTGTSYYNYASPLIRYNTQDEIIPNSDQNGFLTTFKIKDGRIGEFIIDGDNNKISLTALIYGRHHKLFDVSSHIQIKQLKNGEAIIYYTTKNKNVVARDHFDSSGVNIKFDFQRLDSPFKTKSGKVKLLIS